MTMLRWCWLLPMLLLGCVAQPDDLRVIAEQPPVDRAVLVTGGAFLTPLSAGRGTFGDLDAEAGSEVIPLEKIIDVLQRGSVFQRVAIDPVADGRRVMRDRFRLGRGDPKMQRLMEQARDDGFDLLMIVEELQDGPIDQLGTNGRWPVTMATWLLLGIGALIPDRTFEPRAALRITLRELQTGAMLVDPLLLVAGPIDLNLIERTDFLGLLTSVVVPPFWVGDDAESVREVVQATTVRRLLLSLARDLKSESLRQRLRERAPARIEMVDTPAGLKVTVSVAEALSIVRLRCEADAAGALSAAFEQQMLASMHAVNGWFQYEALLPTVVLGSQVQVSVGTLRGGIASATFAPGGRQ